MFKKKESGSILYKLEILIKVERIYILQLGTFDFRAQIVIRSSGSEKPKTLFYCAFNIWEFSSIETQKV